MVLRRRFPALHSLALLLVIACSIQAAQAESGPTPRRSRSLQQTKLLRKEIFPELLDQMQSLGRFLVDCVAHFSFASPYERMQRAGDYSKVIALKQRQLEYNPQNILPFINDAASFRGIAKNEFGFCAGMTSYTKKVLFLGFFDPENLAHEAIPARKQKSKWLEFYTQKLDEIDAGRATSIPGFPDLLTFTSDPEIRRLVKKRIVADWADDAIEIQSLKMYYRALTPIEPKELARTVANLKRRSEAGEMPRVLFSAHMAHPGRDRPIHSLMVRKVESEKNGTTRLYVWETNIEGPEQVKEPPFIEIDSKGKMAYGVWRQEELDGGATNDHAGQVVRLIEMKADHDFMAMAVNEIKDFCAKHPELCPKPGSGN